MVRKAVWLTLWTIACGGNAGAPAPTGLAKPTSVAQSPSASTDGVEAPADEPGVEDGTEADPVEVPAQNEVTTACANDRDEVEAVLGFVSAGLPATLGHLAAVGPVTDDAATGMRTRALRFTEVRSVTAAAEPFVDGEALVVAQDALSHPPEEGKTYLLVLKDFLEGNLLLRADPLCADEAVRTAATEASR